MRKSFKGTSTRNFRRDHQDSDYEEEEEEEYTMVPNSGDEEALLELIEETEDRKTWQETETRLLLSLTAKHYNNIGKSNIKTKSKMWKVIAEELRKAGYHFQPEQVQSKFRGMERQYKRLMQKCKNGEKNLPSCPYFYELNAILKARDANKEPNNSKNKPEDPIKTDCEANDDSDESEEETPRKRHRPSENGVIRILRKITEDSKKQHHDILESLQRIAESRNEQVEIIRERNELLRQNLQFMQSFLVKEE